MNTKTKQTTTGLEIAVIGMSGRFPGANSISQFWENIKAGMESISFFSDEELKAGGISPTVLDNPDYIKAKGIILGIEYFDSDFFDYTPKEVEIMDPQVRLFHECAWEALEDAGYNPWTYPGVIGLYAGASPNIHWEGMTHLSQKNRLFGSFAANFNNDKDFLPLLIAYKMNLKGPVISFFTTCSTSLVGIHLGCRSLLTGECHMVLAGGVTVTLPQKSGHLYQEGMVISSDGHCRAFDGQADGTMGGEGIGVVVLKPLAAAATDGDHIYAVIKGSAVNNDGDRRVGFTAPSISGQAEAIIRAMHMAEVAPGSIRYIEAHGTGTSLGDPIEIEALKMAFKSDKTASCAIGSVKTNIGHLDCAAGIAGFIKAVLILKHKTIPPSLHFENPNPKIDFKNSPFYVNAALTPLENTPFPLRVGISSFGMGGTNAHVILEEYFEGTGGLAPLLKEEARARDGSMGPPPGSPQYQLILLSAKTEPALAKAAENLAAFLKDNPDINLADMTFTLQQGRKHFLLRRKFACSDVNEAITLLTSTGPGKIQTSAVRDEKNTVVFMFPGLGPQYVDMGRQLYEKEPVFRREMNRCIEILNGLADYDIKKILYPDDSVSEVSEESSSLSYKSYSSNRSNKSYKNINQTEIAQVVIFIFEYALSKLLMKWGIKPNAMIGYSLGEYTAACLSGVFSLEDALKIMVIRGKLINRLPPGGMLSVPLAKEQLEPLLVGFTGELSIAIDNGPSCIVSGAEDTVAAFEGEMKKKKLFCLRLQTSNGIHSPAMGPILKEFEQELAQFHLNTPQIPYISNVTGNWIGTEKPTEPCYWTKHLAGTVRFAEGINRLSQEPNPIFIEVGPDRELCTLLTNQPDNKLLQKTVNLIRPKKNNIPDLYYLMSKVGQLWLYGINIHWQELYPGQKRHRLSLPTYPFEQRYYPLKFDIPGQFIPAPVKDALEEKKFDISDWFYYPSWIRSQLSLRDLDNSTAPGPWLFFALENEFCSLFTRELKQAGHEVIIVTMGEEFKLLEEKVYTLSPGLESDYTLLLQELNQEGKMPSRIVHSWSMEEDETGENQLKREDIEKTLNPGFYSLIYLAKALGKQKVFKEVQLHVITNHLQEVTGEEEILPQKTPILGPLKVIPQEYPFIRCKNVDILLPEPGSTMEAKLAAQLMVELTQESLDTDIAYRNGFRWLKTFRPIRFREAAARIPFLQERGVYLITGGMGKIGLTLAGYLAESVNARLILVGRSEFPARDQWEQILTNAGNGDITALKIRELKKIEARGGQVLTFFTDVTDQAGMEAVISQAEQRFGPINGVIHAAGDTRDSIMRSIEHLTPSDCQQQFMPKIYGLLTLEKVLRGKKLDFCWLTSSLSPILGGLGFSAYSAANHFMDAFVKWIYHSNPVHPVHWISVNWADWNFDPGKGKSPDRSDIEEQGEMKGDAWWMTPHEGIDTFRRILSHCDAHQVVVSTVDLQTRLDRWVTLKSIREPGENHTPSPTAVSYRSRAQLETSFVKPVNRIEQVIAGVLQDFLGIEEVGTHDNFFELGATSLNIIRINSIAREKLQQEISVMWWFERPTIKALSAYLLEQTRENPGEQAAVKVKKKKRAQALEKGKTHLKQLKKRVTR